MALTGLDIFRLLPKTNCKKCGFPTCLAFAMALAKDSGDMDFLTPFMSPATLSAIERARPELRHGLMLASPDFMYK